MAKSNRSSRKRAKGRKQTARPTIQAPMIFSRLNYRYLLLSVGLIIVGYTLMRWENEVDGIISLYLAPVILFAGYMGVIYAILKRPKSNSEKA